MIGKIKGILDEIIGSCGLIETASGIYYRVYIPQRILARLAVGSECILYTYHHIREDTQRLYGFHDYQEYKLYELLLSVDGVGPKTAFVLLSSATGQEIISAVQHNDKDFFTSVKGLGKKTALKILIELSNKFDTEFEYTPEEKLNSDDQTVVDALVSLGFSQKESSGCIKQIIGKYSVEEKIKLAIKQLTKHSQ